MNIAWESIFSIFPKPKAREIPEEEQFWLNLSCAVILQALEDWNFLDQGEEVRLRLDSNMVYTIEVENFFLGKWFEFLLSYTLPSIPADVVREKLNCTEGAVNARQAHRTEDQKKVETRYLKVCPNFRRTGIRYGGEEPKPKKTTRKYRRRKRTVTDHLRDERGGSSCLDSRKTQS